MRTPSERSGRPRPVARYGLLAVTGLLLAGCAGGPDPVVAATGAAADSGAAGTSPTAPASVVPGAAPGLTAEVVQYRRDAQRDVIQVKVTNDGDDAVRVERVEVRSDTLAAPATADKDSTVGAGVSVDLTVPLTEPGCDPADEAVDDPATAGPPGGAPDRGGDATAGPSPVGVDGHVAVLVVDGARVELDVDDAVLQQVRAQRCAEAAVGEVVTAVWRPVWEDVGEVGGEPALRGGLVLTPMSDAPVTVTAGGATTLFTVQEPVQTVLRSDEQVLDLVVAVARCDPHAVAEDKKGYLFPVRVTPEGGEEVVLDVTVPVPERAPLQDLIERTCY